MSSQVEELSRKLDTLMMMGQNSNMPSYEVCALCSDPSHDVFSFPSTSQFSDFVEEQGNAIHQFPKQGYSNNQSTNMYS